MAARWKRCRWFGSERILINGEHHVTTLIFSAAHHRLTVRGPVLDGDLRHLSDALETFGRSCPGLVLDLTHVRVVSRQVAESVARSCRSLQLEGISVLVWTRPHSAADRMLHFVREDQDELLTI